VLSSFRFVLIRLYRILLKTSDSFARVMPVIHIRQVIRMNIKLISELIWQIDVINERCESSFRELKWKMSISRN